MNSLAMGILIVFVIFSFGFLVRMSGIRKNKSVFNIGIFAFVLVFLGFTFVNTYEDLDKSLAKQNKAMKDKFSEFKQGLNDLQKLGDLEKFNQIDLENTKNDENLTNFQNSQERMRNDNIYRK